MADLLAGGAMLPANLRTLPGRQQMTSSGISWSEALAMAGGISGFFVACLIFLSRRIVRLHDEKIIEITKTVEKLGGRVSLCEVMIVDRTAEILLKQHEHLDYVKDNYIKTAAVHKLFDDLKTEIRLAHATQNTKFDSLLDMMHQMLMRDHNARSADKVK